MNVVEQKYEGAVTDRQLTGSGTMQNCKITRIWQGVTQPDFAIQQHQKQTFAVICVQAEAKGILLSVVRQGKRKKRQTGCG